MNSGRRGLMRAYAIGLLAALLVGAAQPSWPFEPINLTFEDGYRIESSAKKKRPRPGRLYAPIPYRGQQGREFRFVTDPGSEYEVGFSSQAASGSRSLMFKLSSNRDVRAKDKIMMNIVNRRDDERLAMGFDNVRYISFDFMLDPRYETPSHWLTHLQARQCCGDQPPFAMKVAPSDDKRSEVQFTFVARDDETPKTPQGAKEIYRMTVPRSQWNRIVLRLEPSHMSDDKQGRITMWYNDVQKFDYQGDWGYSTDRLSRRGRELSDELFVGIGIYRLRQATTQIILFDHIRYGKSFASVTE